MANKPANFFQAVKNELARGLAVSEAILRAKQKHPHLYEAYLRLGAAPDERFLDR
jgi:hypothetical protein